MSDKVDASPPDGVLAYVSADADGVPDFVEAAERAIDQRRQARKIRYYFRTSREAALYFAKSMRRRYPRERIATTCQACGATHTIGWVETAWKVAIPLKSMELGILRESSDAPFNTFHPLCRGCFRQWQWRTRVRRSVFLIMLVSGLTLWCAAFVVGRAMHQLETTLIVLGCSFWLAIIVAFIRMLRGIFVRPGIGRLRLPREVKCLAVTKVD